LDIWIGKAKRKKWYGVLPLQYYYVVDSLRMMTVELKNSKTRYLMRLNGIGYRTTDEGAVNIVCSTGLIPVKLYNRREEVIASFEVEVK